MPACSEEEETRPASTLARSGQVFWADPPDSMQG